MSQQAYADADRALRSAAPLAGGAAMTDDKIAYRVWPDGTVQEAQEPPYPYMSDDFEVVEAEDEADAWEKAACGGAYTRDQQPAVLKKDSRAWQLARRQAARRGANYAPVKLSRDGTVVTVESLIRGNTWDMTLAELEAKEAVWKRK